MNFFIWCITACSIVIIFGFGYLVGFTHAKQFFKIQPKDLKNKAHPRFIAGYEAGLHDKKLNEVSK